MLIRGCGTADAAGGLLILVLGRALYLGGVSLIVFPEGFFGGAGVGSFSLPILIARTFFLIRVWPWNLVVLLLILILLAEHILLGLVRFLWLG